MSKQLRLAGSGARGVSRILRKQVKKALEELQGDGRKLSDETVHGVRKRLKKARAALRLLRETLGSQWYRRQNIALRDAARPLTDVRDAKVLVATVDKLAPSVDGEVNSGALSQLKQHLLDLQRKARQRVLGEKDSVAPTRQSLQATLKQVKRTSRGRPCWSALGSGLKRVYRGARNAFSEAKKHPSTASLHEWRKQTKYLRHQFEMLEPLWPAAFEALAGQFHLLADQLGDDHDLAMLRERLLQEPFSVPDTNTADVLAKLVDRRRGELQGQALALGPRLYADKPKQFIKHIRCQWRDR